MKRFVKVMVLFAVFILTLYVFDKLQPTITTVTKATQPTPITTYAVYEVRQLQWALDDPADYDYDDSLVNISGGEAKLKLQKVLKEVKNASELSLPVKEEESGQKEYEDEYEFVSAAYSYNGPLQRFYFEADILPKTSVKFKIRTAATEEMLKKADWLGPQGKKGNDFYTASSEKVSDKHGSFGYIQYKAILETDNETATPTLKSITITYEIDEYSAEAAITTKEYQFSRSVEVQTFAVEEDLRGQTVKYQYSTDSGITWKEPVKGQILAAAAGKILIKATLSSNKTETPVVRSITLSYKISTCDEHWLANYTSCGKDDKRTKYYTDANSCGSTDDLPADNGTAESCDYCIPEWTNENSSCRNDNTLAVNYLYTNNCCSETGLPSDCTIPANTTAMCDYCIPLWTETNSSCGKDDRITATFADANDCYAKTGLSSDSNKPQNKTYSCDYCTPSFVCGSYSECNVNDQKTCLQANDTNNCYSQTGLLSDTYTEDYSKFTASCAYDTEKPSVNSAIAAAIGNTLTVMANITDKSAVTATAHIIKDNNAVMNLTLTNTATTASNVYTASASAAGLSGAYIISISARDAYNNAATAKGIAGVSINAEKSAVKEIALNGTGKALIALAANSATIEIKGRAGPTGTGTTGRIVVAEQATDERNTTKPQGKKEFGRYLEVEADEALKSNVSSATLKISYTDEEVAAANVSEASLAVYYYDEPSLLWQVLNSTANAALNYVEGNTTHLSLFGVFGNQIAATNTTINDTTTNDTATNATANQTAPGGSEQQQPQQQEAPAGQNAQNAAAGGGGGGGAAEKPQEGITEQAQKEEEPATTEADAGESCTYDVRLELAGSPQLINKSRTNATLTNTGTCALQNIDVKATPSLDAYIAIEGGKAAELKPSESFTFAIKLKAAAEAERQAQQQSQQPVQGYVVKEPRKAAMRSGKILITGHGVKGIGLRVESGEVQLNEEVPINIEVYEPEQNGGKSSVAATAVGILVLIALLGLLYSRITKGRGGRGNSNDNSNREASNNEISLPVAAEAEKEKGFEEGLKKFEEKWKEQNQQEKMQPERQQFSSQDEASLEGFRETFK